MSIHLLEADWSVISSELEFAEAVETGSAAAELMKQLSSHLYRFTPIPDDTPALTFEVPHGVNLSDWLINPGNRPIFSGDLCRAIGGDGERAQYVPVRVVYPDGRPVERDYYMAVLLQSREIIEGLKRFFQEGVRITLKKNLPADWEICRDAKRCQYIFVSDAMRRALTEQNLTGFTLTESVENRIEIVY